MMKLMCGCGREGGKGKSVMAVQEAKERIDNQQVWTKGEFFFSSAVYLFKEVYSRLSSSRFHRRGSSVSRTFCDSAFSSHDVDQFRSVPDERVFRMVA
jgi:hypothetical protein